MKPLILLRKYSGTSLYCHERDHINCVIIKSVVVSKVCGESDGKIFSHKVQFCGHIT